MVIARPAALVTLLVLLPTFGSTTPPLSLDEALDAQRTLSAAQPRDAQVLNDLGNLLVLAGETEEAEGVYRGALRLAPEFAAPHYNLALLLETSGQRKLAIQALQRVVEIEPNNAWGHYQLGRLFAEKDKRSRALERYTRAFSLDPQLARPEINPHILDNELAAPALLQANSSASAADLAPREYHAPQRISDLLAPPMPIPEKSTAEPSQAPEGEKREISGTSFRSRSASQMPDRVEAPPPAADTRRSADTAARRQATTRPSEVPSAAGRQGTATRPSPRLPRAVGSRQVTPSGPTETRQPTTRGPVGTPTEQPTDPGGSDFEPSLNSTGKLELRLLPDDDDRLAFASAPAPRG